MPGPQPRLHLPFASWPSMDRRLWQDAAQNDDPFSDAAGTRLAKTTLHRLWMGWRRVLGFLAITEATAFEITPAERITIERVRRFADHLAETNTPHSVAIQMDALYGAARAMMPERDWSWLRSVKARLYSAAGRKSPAGAVITSMQLLDLGEQLMAESGIVAGRPVRMADAIRYRDGLMIALLGYIPLRHKNFAAIEIGRDLVKEGENWFIAIPPEDTKTKIGISCTGGAAASSCDIPRSRSTAHAPPAGMQCTLGKCKRRSAVLFRGRAGGDAAHNPTARNSNLPSRCA
jgi:integrase/recombinase XerD